jgi:hypothetical protein
MLASFANDVFQAIARQDSLSVAVVLQIDHWMMIAMPWRNKLYKGRRCPLQ